MKTKNIGGIIVLLFAFGVTGLYAQTSLNVNEKSGTRTSFVLNDLNKLVFSSGNMTVIKKDLNSSVFSLMNVRYLNFTDITSLDEIANPENRKMYLYPNPVVSQLQIRFETMTEENVQVHIMDMQGRMIYLRNLTSHSGINYLSIPCESMQNGIYLCRLQKGNKIEINKFIKQ
ncbi:MAG: T9SS type A sorting domain-containing protein [Paludibacter sp.]|nr:T9SS type A sorting domain-containing protein [Paludibacter sp.]